MDTLAELEKYLAVVFEPTDLVEVRAFHRVKGQGVQRFWKPAREVASLVPKLSGMNLEAEYNIYCGANPRMREGGSNEDVAIARCLFADWDDTTLPDVQERFASASLPPPSLIVGSGHGIHAYWKLTSPLTDLDLWRRAQTALIARAGSDDKIKDPARVMRLPGFVNLPDPEKDEAAEDCIVLGVDAEAKYEVAEVVGDLPAEETKPAQKAPSNGMDRYARLSRSTMQFCLTGAGEGERNSRLFSAACDMAGSDIPMADAEGKLLPVATQCGLTEAEARQSIRSAYCRPRSPAVPDEELEAKSALQRMAPGPSTDPKPSEPSASDPPPTRVDLSGVRPVIGNVLDTLNAEGEAIRYYLPLPQISVNISEATSGWPRRAGGLVFAVRESEDVLPSLRNVIWIANAKELIAWVGHACDVRWSIQDAQHHRKKHKLNPPTKDELFAYLKENASPHYRAVEALPHVPPLPDTFYLPTKLPDVELDDPETPLKELVRRFNPETPIDRVLMLAAMVTPGWGGPPGARPAFVFTSEYGRGVGKTITAQVIAEIWGGTVTVGANEEWEVVRKRLLGNESLVKRIILIDNIKGKFHGGDIEGFITAKELDGWKPYHGQASRPNNLTWFFTANTPSLSRDLADRSVIIKLGKQQHGQGFLRWAMDHIAEHRPAILAECYAILGEGNRCSIEQKNRDRWEAWQDAVLTKFDDGNEMAEAIHGRRPDVDADNEDAEEIAASVLALVSYHYKDHETRRIHITYAQLYQQMIRDAKTDPKFGPRNFNSWIKERCGTGPLYFLKPHRKPTGDGARGWIYIGEEAPKGQEEFNEIFDGTTQKPS